VSELGIDGDVTPTQEITEVTAAEERSAGETVTDEGDAHEKIVQFLEKLKVV
jgi:electron transfer flavoprotein alpha/beta subunit